MDESPSDGLAELSDRVLLDRMRAGDDAAFGALYSRHADAVRAFAARASWTGADADDLTAEAFFRVLQTVRNGSGPVDYVRAYLITVTRRVAAEWRARRFDVPVSDEELLRHSEPGVDGTARRDERSLIATAFCSLPERWRSVLWRVEVEGQRPAVVARYFGLSANATAALARRARNGLRAAYLQAHLSTVGGPSACRSVTQKLGAYTAGGLRGSEMRRVGNHLAECPACRSLHAELSDVCSGLRAHAGLLLVPVAAGLASAGPAASGAGSSAAAGTAMGKLAVVTARAKLSLAAASVTAVGTLGVGFGPLLSEANPPMQEGLDGNHGNIIAVSPDPTTPAPSSMPLKASSSPHHVSGVSSGAQGGRQQGVSSEAGPASRAHAARPAEQPEEIGVQPARLSPADGHFYTMATSSTATSSTDTSSTATPSTATSSTATPSTTTPSTTTPSTTTSTEDPGTSAGNEISGSPTPVPDTSVTPTDAPGTGRHSPSDPSKPGKPSAPRPPPSSIPLPAK